MKPGEGPLRDVIKQLNLNGLEVNALYQNMCEKMYIALQDGNVDVVERALRDLLGPEAPAVVRGELH